MKFDVVLNFSDLPALNKALIKKNNIREQKVIEFHKWNEAHKKDDNEMFSSITYRGTKASLLKRIDELDDEINLIINAVYAISVLNKEVNADNEFFNLILKNSKDEEKVTSTQPYR